MREALRSVRAMRRRCTGIDAQARIPIQRFQGLLQVSEAEVVNAILRRRRREGKFVWPLWLYQRMFHGTGP